MNNVKCVYKECQMSVQYREGASYLELGKTYGDCAVQGVYEDCNMCAKNFEIGIGAQVVRKGCAKCVLIVWEECAKRVEWKECAKFVQRV